MSKFIVLYSLIIFILVPASLSWSQDELDLFDLVEEVNQDFYSFLEISQDASTADIRKAYRKLSLYYHPDKNRDDPNASETFRKLGAVAEVLRDEEKRKMYDNVLEFGLPDWRQPVYYYRKVKKMSFLEITIVLFTIAIIGQFLYGWAQYLEKQLVLYELRQRKDKKDRKAAKGRKNPSMTLEAQLLYYENSAKNALPHYSKLLPCLFVKWIYSLLQFLIYTSWNMYQNWKHPPPKGTESVEDHKPTHRTRKQIIKESQTEDVVVTEEKEENIDKEEDVSEKENGGPVKNGSVIEVKEEKEERLRQLELEKEKEMEEELKALEEEIDEEEASWEDKKRRRGKKAHSSKIKSHLADKSLEYSEQTFEAQTTAGADQQQQQTSCSSKDDIQPNNTNNNWNQFQQKQLEWALTQYGKDQENRWELIAKAVPDKSKEECISRYKELVEIIRKKKSQ